MLATGAAYDDGDEQTCTAAENTLYVKEGAIVFLQPLSKRVQSIMYEDGASYRVVIRGLIDILSGKSAEIRYDVNLFSMRDCMETTVVHAGGDPYESISIRGLRQPDELERLLPILPDTVRVQTENGRKLAIPILGNWTLDAENKRFAAAADASTLPDTVTDPDGLLQRVTLRYSFQKYNSELVLETPGEQVVGGSNVFLLPKDTIYKPGYDLYLLREIRGVWTPVKHFDENSPNFRNEIDSDGWNHPSFRINSWNTADSGLWVSFSHSANRQSGKMHTLELTTSGSSTVGNLFKDLDCSAYYYDAVLWALENGIAVGTGGGYFCPNTYCTRAQAVTFLWRANGCPEPTLTSSPFTDVQPGCFYYKAVLWALEVGITAGTSSTAFSPNAECTRGQAAAFLWRNRAQLRCDETSPFPFTDVKPTDFCYRPVYWAYLRNITAGKSSTTFGPNDPCTRAQLVTFLYRYYVG